MFKNGYFSAKMPKKCKHCKSEDVRLFPGAPYYFCCGCGALLGEIKPKKRKSTDRSEKKKLFLRGKIYRR